jgi:hypothetical protein
VEVAHLRSDDSDGWPTLGTTWTYFWGHFGWESIDLWPKL